VELMKKVGITVTEKFPEIQIIWTQTEEKLYEQAEELLEVNHDVWNAYRVVNYLTLKSKKDRYLFLLGKCYYFMGEMYYEGLIRKYYQKAYDIFERLVDKDDENIEYLRWQSHAAAKVGSFIRHKERGTFSGLSYLKESISLNDDILDIKSNDLDALLTEGEYQIETDSVPIFGGSEEDGLKIYQKVLRKDPNNMRANLLMGRFYYKKKDKPWKSIPYLIKAINVYDQKKAPQDMKHYYMRIFLEVHLVRAYNEMKNYEKAWHHMKKHLAMLPRSPSGLGYLIEYTSGKYKNEPEIACLAVKRRVQMEPYGRKEGLMKRLCAKVK
jgi:tetratricopeptide (TPR) repeat protein